MAVVRKSFDARKTKRFIYVVDVAVQAARTAGASALRHQPGVAELIQAELPVENGVAGAQ